MAEPWKDIWEALENAVKNGGVGIAFAGALAAESFWPASTILREICNVIVGTAISCYTAPVLLVFVVGLWPDLKAVRGALEGAMFFWLGLLGMQLVPAVQLFIRNRIKAAAGG